MLASTARVRIAASEWLAAAGLADEAVRRVAGFAVVAAASAGAASYTVIHSAARRRPAAAALARRVSVRSHATAGLPRPPYHGKNMPPGASSTVYDIHSPPARPLAYPHMLAMTSARSSPS